MPNSVFKSISGKTEGTEFYEQLPKNYERGKTKYIVITGSVISGVGKGTFSSCLGSTLQMYHGFDVTPLKFECYVNYDSGTLNPFRHGEVFVLDDGTETDLDLGTYERMLNKNLSNNSFVTMGKVFKTIIDKERSGHYLGRDVEFIPHVTGEVKNFVRKLAMESKSDIILIEIGGTVGEIQNSLYLEAMRELAYEEGRENVCFINVTYVLQPNALGEQKSKAAQLGIKTLMSTGIQPDIIVCRSERPITNKIKEKISIYSNVPVSRTIGFHDTKNIYHFPIELHEKGIDKAIGEILGLSPGKARPELGRWEKLAKETDDGGKEITIAIAGKYTNVHDSYMSILKAIEHTSPYHKVKPKIKWIETTDVEKGKLTVEEAMKGVDGLIVPGAFGQRGAEGMITCIKYAREKKVPYLGLCFGFQMAVIEFARNVCGAKDANSSELCEQENAMICILPEQEEIKELGGSMRLGGYDVIVKKNTLAHKLYGKERVRERFRHRWNMNTKYIDMIEKNGMEFSGFAPQKRIMQILEVGGHPFFMATQFHPELTSKPLEPNPIFSGFIKACAKKA